MQEAGTLFPNLNEGSTQTSAILPPNTLADLPAWEDLLSDKDDIASEGGDIDLPGENDGAQHQ